MSSTPHAAAHPHHVDLRHAPELDHHRQQLQAYLLAGYDVRSTEIQRHLKAVGAETTDRLAVIKALQVPQDLEPRAYTGVFLLFHAERVIKEVLSTFNDTYRSERCEYIVYVLWLFEAFHALHRVICHPAKLVRVEGTDRMDLLHSSGSQVPGISVHGNVNDNFSHNLRTFLAGLKNNLEVVFKTENSFSIPNGLDIHDRTIPFFTMRNHFMHITENDRSKLHRAEPSLAHFDCALAAAIVIKHWRLDLDTIFIDTTTMVGLELRRKLKKDLAGLESALKRPSEPWPGFALRNGNDLTELELTDLVNRPMRDLRDIGLLAFQRRALLTYHLQSYTSDLVVGNELPLKIWMNVETLMLMIGELQERPPPIPDEFFSHTGKPLLFQVKRLLDNILHEGRPKPQYSDDLPGRATPSNSIRPSSRTAHLIRLLWLIQAVQAVHRIIQTPLTVDYQKVNRTQEHEYAPLIARTVTETVIVHGPVKTHIDQEQVKFVSAIDRFLQIVFSASDDDGSLSGLEPAASFSVTSKRASEFLKYKREMEEAWSKIATHTQSGHSAFADCFRPCFFVAIGFLHWHLLISMGRKHKAPIPMQQSQERFDWLSNELASTFLPGPKGVCVEKLHIDDLPNIPPPAL